MWAVIKFVFLQGKAPKEIHAILTETLASFLPCRAKDLSAPLYLCSIQSAYPIIILSPVTHLAVQNLSKLSPKRHDFRKKIIEDKMFVLIFSTTFAWKTFYSKNNSERNCHNNTHVFKYSNRYSCQMWYNLNFPDISLENNKIPYFTKVLWVLGELLHQNGLVDGWRGRRDEADSRLSQFCKRTCKLLLLD